MNKVPSVAQLRRAGYKVRVLHNRAFDWRDADDGFSDNGFAYLTRHEVSNPPPGVWIEEGVKFGNCLPTGGFTKVEVTLLYTGETVTAKYNVGPHPFVKKKNVSICLAKIIGKIGEFVGVEV